MAAWLICLLLASSTPAQETQSPNDRLFRLHGIAPTNEAITSYFDSLLENREERSQFTALIQGLSDDSYAAREASMKSLLEAKVVHFDLLEQAVKSANAETRFRAVRVLESFKTRTPQQRREEVLRAVLSVVSEKRITGLCAPILEITPRCSDALLENGITSAISATAQPQDLDLLKRGLDDESPRVRVAAIAGLQSLLGEQAINHVDRLLDDANDSVRLSAGRVLTNLSDRRGILALGQLLESKNVVVRARAAFALRQLSGKWFGFQAFDDLAIRAESVIRWHAWINGEGKNAKLILPIENFSVDSAGLVLHLPFGDDGQQAVDSSESKNHGVVHNALQTAQGRLGAGCKLDGKGDYLNVPNSDSLEIRERLSLAVWVKLDSFEPGGYGNEEGHFIKKGDPLWWNPAFGLGYNKRHHTAKFVIGDPQAPKNGGGKSLYSAVRLELNRWYYLVGTYDGETAKLFLNGRLAAETKYAGRIRGDRAPVLLGGGKLYSKSEFADHFTISGTIDEVRIYNRALSAAEVDFLFSSN